MVHIKAPTIGELNMLSREIFVCKQNEKLWSWKERCCKAMAGFDDPGIFFSDNFGSEDQQDDLQIDRQHIKNKFKEFIRQFHEGNFTYRYRCVAS